MKRMGWAGVVGLLLVLVLLGWFVWPTPYEYVDVAGLRARRHRITHKVEVFVPQKGYVPAR
jgi:hypothetical protein